jgi:CxxC motif-containing protein (DUF1111 family)
MAVVRTAPTVHTTVGFGDDQLQVRLRRQLGNPAVIDAGGFFTPAGCHPALDHRPCLLTALDDTEAVAVQPELGV